VSVFVVRHPRKLSDSYIRHIFGLNNAYIAVLKLSKYFRGDKGSTMCLQTKHTHTRTYTRTDGRTHAHIHTRTPNTQNCE